MSGSKKMSRALISVFHKEGLAPIIHHLATLGVRFVSTGGTGQFIEGLGYPVEYVEKLTGYPSIFGGRVKTLHPAIFGGILYRREVSDDLEEARTHHIDPIDLVIVDLYPFEETVAEGKSEEEIVEKVDIGGIALIRAAAKNFEDVLVVAAREYYYKLLELLENGNGFSNLEERRWFSAAAFDITSHYDTSIFNYFNRTEGIVRFKRSIRQGTALRYGENPHQNGTFFGNLSDLFDQIHGKELSYNNLVDIDAAVGLLQEFVNETAFIIIKHTNACGVATGSSVLEAYNKALQADPVSAFGGILACTGKIDKPAAEEIHKLFFEILIAPAYDAEALDILRGKKNRILLIQKKGVVERVQFKSLLNGVILQDSDLKTENAGDLKTVTHRSPTDKEVKGLLFAAKIAKHSKSNTIVLALDGQLVASGVGQTSRVDALKQAIEKAHSNHFELVEAVMASDAFFPFADCVEIANREGIRAVVQPGGSVRDQDSIDYCDHHNMAMVVTGIRHFRH